MDEETLKKQIETCKSHLEIIRKEGKACKKKLKKWHKGATKTMEGRDACLDKTKQAKEELETCKQKYEKTNKTLARTLKKEKRVGELLFECQGVNKVIMDGRDEVLAEGKQLDEELGEDAPTQEELRPKKQTSEKKERPRKQKKKMLKENGETQKEDVKTIEDIIEKNKNKEYEKVPECDSEESCKHKLREYVMKVRKLKVIIQQKHEAQIKGRKSIEDMKEQVAKIKACSKDCEKSLEMCKEEKKVLDEKIDKSVEKAKRNLELQLVAKKQDLEDCEDAKHGFSRQVLDNAQEIDELRVIKEKYDKIKTVPKKLKAKSKEVATLKEANDKLKKELDDLSSRPSSGQEETELDHCIMTKKAFAKQVRY